MRQVLPLAPIAVAQRLQSLEVPSILHFEPSLDALSLRSDVISSKKIHSLLHMFSLREGTGMRALLLKLIDSGLVGSTDFHSSHPQGHEPLWEGYHESRRCTRDTYPESYITKYTSIRR